MMQTTEIPILTLCIFYADQIDLQLTLLSMSAIYACTYVYDNITYQHIAITSLGQNRDHRSKHRC